MEDSNYLDTQTKKYIIPEGHYEITKRYFKENGQPNPTDKEIREFYFLHMHEQISMDLIFRALERKRK